MINALPGCTEATPPPFNICISNVPGAREPGTGRLLAAGFSRVLDRMLRTSLKPYIESRATASRADGEARTDGQ